MKAHRKNIGLWLAALGLFGFGSLWTLQGLARAHSLEGKGWRLIWMAGHTLVPNTNATLKFRGNRAFGNATCNGFSGSYKAGKRTLQFFNTISSTKACVRGMRQEAAYLKRLRSTDRYLLVGDVLTLYHQKTPQLRYKLLPKTPDAPFTNTRWRLNAWIASIAPGLSPMATHSRTTPQYHLTFSKGQIQGKLACGSFTAQYKRHQTHLSITGITSTQTTCKNPDTTREVKQFLETLAKIKSYRIKKTHLTLQVHPGQQLAFIKSP